MVVDRRGDRSAGFPVAGTPPLESTDPVVSVVLPCLNEASSVGECVRAALAALDTGGLAGEVIVADNGSTDGSADIARAAGARVVHVPERGYGNAYHAGMAAAVGTVLVMADADGTYPMEDIPRLAVPVLEGRSDMVIASRMRGTIHSMPWTHRYIGNPILTGLLNRLFGIKVSDVHSGMRAVRTTDYRRLQLSTPGMEYASEMVTQAARLKLRIAEIPIEYRERVGASKLRTWQDGWRHLKFLLLASPTWLFLIPGAALCLLGLLLVVPMTFGEVHLGSFHLILHPMIAGSVMVITGYQMLQFGVLVRACRTPLEGAPDGLADFVHERLTMERMMATGALLFVAGAAIGLAIAANWMAHGFGSLSAIRPAITAMTLTVLGTQTIFGSFLFAFFLPLRFGGGVVGQRPAVTVIRGPIKDDGPSMDVPGIELAGSPRES